MHYKRHPAKPLVSPQHAEAFLELFDNEMSKKLAKHLFIEGKTNLETAELADYSVRQIERLRGSLLKTAVVKLLDKQATHGGSNK